MLQIPQVRVALGRTVASTMLAALVLLLAAPVAWGQSDEVR